MPAERLRGLAERLRGLAERLRGLAERDFSGAMRRKRQKSVGETRNGESRNKEVKERCDAINNARVENVPTVESNGITRTAFAADIADAANDDIPDRQAQSHMKRDVRDARTSSRMKTFAGLGNLNVKTKINFT